MISNFFWAEFLLALWFGRNVLQGRLTLSVTISSILNQGCQRFCDANLSDVNLKDFSFFDVFVFETAPPGERYQFGAFAHLK